MNDRPGKTWRGRLANLALVLVSTVLTLAALELAFRAYKGEWGLNNHLGEARSLFQAAYRARFDPDLGWVPREGRHPDNVWGTRVTILPGGVRANGEAGGDVTAAGDPAPGGEAAAGAGVILAVGDSFTFGDQVSDADTWPAQLERRLGRPVINGGVFGYGLDQSYLRLLDLLPRYPVAAVVVGLIPNDVARCGLAERTAAAKPYFEVDEAGGLRLRREHMPREEPEPSSLTPLQEVLGYSFFVHRILRRAAPQWWLQGSWRRSTRVHDRGMDVACGIFSRLGDLSRQRGIPVYVLAQYEHNEWLEEDLAGFSEMLARCVQPGPLRLVDTLAPLQALQGEDAAGYDALYIGHMSPAGNALVADLLASAMADGE